MALGFLGGQTAPGSTPPADSAHDGIIADRPIKGVIELFTSQGCSSCPPADALLAKYADSREVIALSFSVDYWNYLGWKDTLAQSRFTERQRAYAKTRGDGAVYTPQVVIDGTTHVVGSNKGEIDRAIEDAWPKFSTSRVPVRFWMQGGATVIETGAAPEGKPAKEATVWFAVVSRKVEVPIKSGENGGRSIVYTNVVRELVPIGVWSGKAMSIRIARHAALRPETDAFAVLIQQGEGGPIIGAAWMGL